MCELHIDAGRAPGARLMREDRTHSQSYTGPLTHLTFSVVRPPRRSWSASSAQPRPEQWEPAHSSRTSTCPPSSAADDGGAGPSSSGTENDEPPDMIFCASDLDSPCQRPQTPPPALPPPPAAACSRLHPREHPGTSHHAAPLLPPDPPPLGPSAVLLQGFNWESCRFPGRGWYRHLSALAPWIAALGASAIWLPPPADSVSEEGYLPRDLYDLDSRYGTAAELRAAVAALRAAGITVIADVVLNHRCAHTQSPTGAWNRFGGKLSWDATAIVSDDPNFEGRGNPSPRGASSLYHAAPNIDHSQPFVRRDLTEWLRWLRADVGFSGWRLDHVRGFSGAHAAEYLRATAPCFAVGEYWDSLAYDPATGALCANQDPHRQRIVDWVDATGGAARAFDVTTKGILHAAVGSGEYWRLRDARGGAPGVLGWWPGRSVTFVENHDTGSTQGLWRFPEGREMQGYAYILTHPGTPTVFWDHALGPEWAHLHGPIARLVALRSRMGVGCESRLEVLRAEPGLYAACVGGVLAVKLGPAAWQPPLAKWGGVGEGPAAVARESCFWELAESGRDWAVWALRPAAGAAPGGAVGGGGGSAPTGGGLHHQQRWRWVLGGEALGENVER